MVEEEAQFDQIPNLQINVNLRINSQRYRWFIYQELFISAYSNLF